MLTSTAPYCMKVFKLDLQRRATEQVTIKASDGGPRLMTFHRDKAESSEFATKDIGGKLNVANLPILGK
jgi:hypothetical protein